MLSNTLNTNEVRNAGGTEVEFQSISLVDRTHEYAQINETPSLPHRLKIQHQESGKGIKARRRSVIRIDKTSMSPVDSVTPVTNSCYIVSDIAVGGINSMSEPAAVLAELISLVATTGSSTLLYDGTGNGAQALLTGGL